MIKRLIHVYCDKCGAEGPCVIGEKRPELLQDILKLGWKITAGNQHVCMECVKPKETVVGVDYARGDDRGVAVKIERAPDGVIKVVDFHVEPKMYGAAPCPVDGCEAPQADLKGGTQHWTEARKQADK